VNKKDIMLNIIDSTQADTIPAAFFMHFDPAFHQGQAAIEKHLKFFHYTNMDFIKIQSELPHPSTAFVHSLEDWEKARPYPDSFFEPIVKIVQGLVEAAHRETLVIMTLYSPFMWANQIAGENRLANQLKEHPAIVNRGLGIMTDNVIKLIKGCIKAGVDGFYVSTQGGEAFRFKGTDLFNKYIKPIDLAVWNEITSLSFNILHVCDYYGEYDDLTPFLDYPGHIVNCSLELGGRKLSPKEVEKMFKRPFMGGMNRRGIIHDGNLPEIQKSVESILAEAPEKFILAADCTMLDHTPWDHLRTAISTAHQYKRK
jgi:uroporphyrinogen decarboxylase